MLAEGVVPNNIMSIFTAPQDLVFLPYMGIIQIRKFRLEKSPEIQDRPLSRWIIKATIRDSAYILGEPIKYSPDPNLRSGIQREGSDIC